jgi:hypothetical protein
MTRDRAQCLGVRFEGQWRDGCDDCGRRRPTTTKAGWWAQAPELENGECPLWLPRRRPLTTDELCELIGREPPGTLERAHNRAHNLGSLRIDRATKGKP